MLKTDFYSNGKFNIFLRNIEEARDGNFDNENDSFETYLKEYMKKHPNSTVLRSPANIVGDDMTFT